MPSGKDIRAGRAFVEIGVRDRLSQGLRNAQRKLRAFGTSLTSIGTRLTAVSTALAAPLALSVKIFSDFTDQMAVVRAVTQATEDQFHSLTEQAKELGRTTSFTASQVAGAMIELGRAGFSTDEISRAISSILDLSRSTATELPRSAELAAASLRGFQLSAGETTRVADVLTAAANGSAQTLDDLGESLKFVTPFAVEAGSTIEETAAALGLLANNGIKGSLAGTSLARAYKNIAAGHASGEFQRLAVATEDAVGNLRPIATILEDLGRKTASLGSAERLGIFEKIFGRGAAAALKLGSPTAIFDDLLERLRASDGLARKTAETMDDNLGGSFRKLFSAVEGVAISIGEALNVVVREAADFFRLLSGAVSEWIKKNQGAVAAAALAVAGIGVLGAALTVAGFAAIGMSAALGVLAGAVTFITSPFGLALAAVSAATVGLLKFTDTGRAAVEGVVDTFGRIKGVVVDAMRGIGDALAAGDLKLAGQIAMKGLELAFRTGVNPIIDLWGDFTTTLKNTIDIAAGKIIAVIGEMLKKAALGFSALEAIGQLGLTFVTGGDVSAAAGAAFAGAAIRSKPLVDKIDDFLSLTQGEVDARTQKRIDENNAAAERRRLALEQLTEDLGALGEVAREAAQRAERVDNLGGVGAAARFDAEGIGAAIQSLSTRGAFSSGAKGLLGGGSGAASVEKKILDVLIKLGEDTRKGNATLEGIDRNIRDSERLVFLA